MKVERKRSQLLIFSLLLVACSKKPTIFIDAGHGGKKDPGIVIRGDKEAPINLKLAKKLKKYRKRDILLVSHSMGTVISYDVLTQLASDSGIHTFITLGSPLGLPAVIKKIFVEQHKDLKNEKLLVTPENIRQSWFNFSDLNDRVALDYKLCNDFIQNSQEIGPKDTIVQNDYENHGKKDHHKSYGYLRTPEVAEVIDGFLTGGRLSSFELLQELLGRFQNKAA